MYSMLTHECHDKKCCTHKQSPKVRWSCHASDLETTNLIDGDQECTFCMRLAGSMHEEALGQNLHEAPSFDVVLWQFQLFWSTFSGTVCMMKDNREFLNALQEHSCAVPLTRSTHAKPDRFVCQPQAFTIQKFLCQWQGLSLCTFGGHCSSVIYMDRRSKQSTVRHPSVTTHSESQAVGRSFLHTGLASSQ